MYLSNCTHSPTDFLQTICMVYITHKYMLGESDRIILEITEEWNISLTQTTTYLKAS